MKKKHISNYWIFFFGLIAWLIGYGMQGSPNQETITYGSAVSLIGTIFVICSVIGGIISYLKNRKKEEREQIVKEVKESLK